jgi:hypothetical protein
MSQLEKLLSAARSKLGITESPAKSNTVEFNTWYYGKAVSGANYAWCAVFALWCAFTAGILGLLWGTLNDAKRAVAEGCGSWVTLAKKQGRWVTSGFKPGDFVIFDWNGTRTRNDHIGIVESVNADGSLVTLEGNTSSSDSGSQSNGGGVFRRTRAVKWVTGAFRPAYEMAQQTDGEKAIAELVKLGRITNPDAWTKLVDGRDGDDVKNLEYVFIKWLADARKADGIK